MKHKISQTFLREHELSLYDKELYKYKYYIITKFGG